MIVLSLVLVVISAISLLIGGLFRDDLALIYVSIGAALAAAVFLAIGVLKGRGRRKPVIAATLPGEDLTGRPATWQGGGVAGAQAVDAALARDAVPGDSPDAAVISTTEVAQELGDETVRIDESAYKPPSVDATLIHPTLALGAPAAPDLSAPTPPAAPQHGWAPPPSPPPPPPPQRAPGPAPPPPPPPPASPVERTPGTPPPPPP